MILKKKQDTKAFDPKKYQVGSLTEGDILNIKKVYDSLDTGHKGYLEPKDIAQALHREGFNASRETVYDIVAEYD
jgi:Ca2+-binding EF-hand superfamily protein